MRVKIVLLLILGLFVTSLGPTGVATAKDRGGKGKGRGHNHKQIRGNSHGTGHASHRGVASGHHGADKWKGHKHGGHHYLAINPSGISFSYQGRNFGVSVGPLAGVSDYPYPPSYLDRNPHPVFVERYDEPHQPGEGLYPTVVPTEPAAAEYQVRAEEAFRTLRYEEALRFAEHALVDDPQNGKLHLFLSQVLFAVGHYEGAAAYIRRGVSLLDKRDWGFVVANYDSFYDSAHYVEQMEQLVAFSKEHPDAADACLVRGYHYAFLGYSEPARQQLSKALELEPRDEVAEALLTLLDGYLPAPAPVGELDN